MKYLLRKPIRKMTTEEFESELSSYAEPVKKTVLQYLKSFEPCSFTSESVRDIYSKEIVESADNARSDGVYRWYDSEIYHFEKYNLKIDDDFIHYVLNQAKNKSCFKRRDSMDGNNMEKDGFICRECDGDLSDFAKRDAKYANYTQEDFDAEFEKFRKEFAEKYKKE